MGNNLARALENSTSVNAFALFLAVCCSLTRSAAVPIGRRRARITFQTDHNPIRMHQNPFAALSSFVCCCCLAFLLLLLLHRRRREFLFLFYFTLLLFYFALARHEPPTYLPFGFFYFTQFIFDYKSESSWPAVQQE
jgi:hypothetical protein